MGVLCYVLGRSGTGKSYSMRNFKKGEIGVINVQGKILPFKGSGNFDIVNTDDSSSIVKNIKEMSKKYKTIVVDDFQYVMANEFMRRATERGYDKFTEIAKHAWDIADCVTTLPADVIVYVMCHTDTDQDGFEKLKTIGKLLDEKIVLEGMSTIVLKTAVSDGQYMFLTQNNGKDTVKSPAGMFPSYAIDNDLKYVDEKIRNYFELGDYKADEEIAEMDEAAKHEEVTKEEPKRRSRRSAKTEEEKPAEASEEKTEEEPAAEAKRVRRAKEDIPNDNGVNEGIDAEPAEKPRRTRRKAAEEVTEELIEEPLTPEAEVLAENAADNGETVPTRRRRRRA